MRLLKLAYSDGVHNLKDTPPKHSTHTEVATTWIESKRALSTSLQEAVYCEVATEKKFYEVYVWD